MDIESVDVARSSVIEAKWRGETLLVRGDTNRSPTDYRVLGFLMLAETTSLGAYYEFEPVAKKLQKNCRAFMRGAHEFNEGWSSPGRISFAPGYETVSTAWRGDKRVRVN